jgi:hypothetical protein
MVKPVTPEIGRGKVKLPPHGMRPLGAADRQAGPPSRTPDHEAPGTGTHLPRGGSGLFEKWINSQALLYDAGIRPT